MDGHSPQKSRPGRVERADYVVRSLRLSRPLHELADSYNFFTPALMVAAGEFDRDPVAQAAVMLGYERLVYYYDYPVDLFKNLGWSTLITAAGPATVNWNRRVYIAPKVGWQKLANCLLSFCWMHPSKGEVYTLMHTLKLLLPERGNQPKVVDIFSFQPKINDQVCMLYAGDLAEPLPRPVWVPISQLRITSTIKPAILGQKETD